MFLLDRQQFVNGQINGTRYNETDGGHNEKFSDFLNLCYTPSMNI